MTRTAAIILVVLVAAPLWGGCEDLDPSVVIEGDLQYGECTRAVLPWRPAFASYSPSGEGGGVIRFQGEPGPLNGELDHFVLTIEDERQVRASLGTQLDVVSAGEEGDAQATINFRNRCPGESSLVTTSAGWVRFDRFSGEYESRIEGEFSIAVFDARDPATVLGDEVTGRFSFPVVRFRPYQSFN